MAEPTIRRALDIVAQSGQPCHVQITGGEPTLAPERIEYVADLIRQNGWPFSLAIQTNGTLLTHKLIRLLKDYEIQVGVSLDGPPDIQETLRGGASETLRGLRLLESQGAPFRVTTVVTGTNVASLGRLVLMLSHFGSARGIGLDLLVRKGRAKADEGAVAQAEAGALRRGLKEMITAMNWVNSRRSPPLRLRELDMLSQRVAGGQARSFCRAGSGESMAVGPDGRVYPCGQTLGDPRFAAGDVWNPDTARLQSLRNFHLSMDHCHACQLKDFCPGECPSRLSYNDSDNPYLICHVYRVLWETVGRFNTNCDET